MKNILFSIRDDLDQFGRVFGCPSEAFAKRDLAAAVNNGDSALAFSPADFGLYRLGTFDTVSGKIEVEPVPMLVCRAVDVLADKE